jgi:hypothetical protein
MHRVHIQLFNYHVSRSCHNKNANGRDRLRARSGRTMDAEYSSLQPAARAWRWRVVTWRGFTATLDTGLRTSLRYEVGLRPSPPGIGSLVVAPEVTPPTVVLGDTWELLLG